MPEKTVSFELENKLSELDELGEHLECFLESFDLSKKCMFQIRYAVDELFSNIILHGYMDCKAHLVKLKLSCGKGILTIRMEDDGIAFDPTKAPRPDTQKPLDERSEGGLGIHTSRHFVDGLYYERIGNTNVLKLKKNIRC